MEVSFTVIVICVFGLFVAGFIDSIAGGAGFVTVPSLLLCGVHSAHGSRYRKTCNKYRFFSRYLDFWRGNLILMRSCSGRHPHIYDRVDNGW